MASPLRAVVKGESPTGLAAAPLAEGAHLGDFRIVREVGRGGMGVVYEAEQVSLQRRVALKVLPFAATLDPRRLLRFQNEARAAGQLHHTNIVPVHAVGCERGFHYYAMQFIEGQTLAALIADLRRQERAGKPHQPARPADAEGPPTADYAPACETAAATPVAGLSTDRSGRGKEYYQAVARLGI